MDGLRGTVDKNGAGQLREMKPITRLQGYLINRKKNLFQDEAIYWVGVVPNENQFVWA